MSNRKQDMTIADHLYRNKFRWSNRCVYCGNLANTLDHVLPVSVAARVNIKSRRHMKQGLNRVPCCGECNRLANNEVFFSIREKRAYIQEKIRFKYRDILKVTIWEPEELDELGPTLRRQIKQAMRNRLQTEWRINWPYVDSWVDERLA